MNYDYTFLLKENNILVKTCTDMKVQSITPSFTSYDSASLSHKDVTSIDKEDSLSSTSNSIASKLIQDKDSLIQEDDTVGYDSSKKKKRTIKNLQTSIVFDNIEDNNDDLTENTAPIQLPKLQKINEEKMKNLYNDENTIFIVCSSKTDQKPPGKSQVKNYQVIERMILAY